MFYRGTPSSLNDWRDHASAWAIYAVALLGLIVFSAFDRGTSSDCADVKNGVCASVALGPQPTYSRAELAELMR